MFPSSSARQTDSETELLYLPSEQQHRKQPTTGRRGTYSVVAGIQFIYFAPPTKLRWGSGWTWQTRHVNEGLDLIGQGRIETLIGSSAAAEGATKLAFRFFWPSEGSPGWSIKHRERPRW